MRALLLLLLIIGCARAGAQLRVGSAEPGNVFAVGERVVLTVTGTATPASALHVNVTAFGGRSLPPPEAVSEGRVDLGRLPRGYYEVQISDASQTVRAPVVVLPKVARPLAGRIVTDAADAWLVPPKRFAEAAELLRRAGIGFVRERMSWGVVEPERGRFAWGIYDAMTDEDVRRGIYLDQVFHSVPAWSRSDHATNRYPDDLRDVFNFAREAARHYHGRVKSWEVWNEADIPNFSTDTGSEYAAFLKAAYLGFKAGDPAVNVLQVSYALPAERFARCLYANDTFPYFDIFNYHIYDKPARYPLRAEGHFSRLAAAGAPAYPVWVTEAGIGIEAVDNTLTPADRTRQAAFIAQSCAMSLASGTDRHFYFVFPHYLENGREFGTLDADLKPYPGYAALATAAGMLGRTRYAGRVSLPGTPEVMAQLFDGPGRSVLVIWSQQGRAQVSLPVPGARCEIRDCVGAQQPAGAGDSVRFSVGSEPLYVRLPRGSLQTDGAPHLRWTPAPGTVRPRPSPVVIRLRPPDATIRKREEAYDFPPLGSTTVGVEVYNFSERRCTGTVQLGVPRGWSVDRDSLAVNLRPMDRAALSVKITRPEQGSSENERIRAVFERSGGAASGECTPVAVLLLTDAAPGAHGGHP